MDDVMVAFADDDEGIVSSQGYSFADGGLPSLDGLYEQGETVTSSSSNNSEVACRVFAIGTSTHFTGETSEAEQQMSRSIIATAFSLDDAHLPIEEIFGLLNSLIAKIPVANPIPAKLLSVHAKFQRESLDQVLVGFSMAACGGKIGVTVVSPGDGSAFTLVSLPNTGGYAYIDHHARDPMTGGVPFMLGEGTAIAVWSRNAMKVCNEFAARYRDTDTLYNAIFYIPTAMTVASDKGKEEEEENAAIPMDIDEDHKAAKQEPVVLVVTAPSPSLAKQRDGSPSSSSVELDMGTLVLEEEDEPSSSEGKRKRALHGKKEEHVESEESEEKKLKKQPVVVAAPAKRAIATTIKGGAAAKKQPMRKPAAVSTAVPLSPEKEKVKK